MVAQFGDGTVPPLVLDIDGTITTPEGTIDPRVFSVLREWPAPIVLATGKAFPYPVALCHFIGIPERAIAENGGVLLADREIRVLGDPTQVRAAVEAFQSRGGDLGWGAADTVNRWRETEIAARLSADEDLLESVAAEFDLELVNTGYAYHLKPSDVSKGRALAEVASILGTNAKEFVAIGDSENDVSTFAAAGESYAVANADTAATEAADHVLTNGYMDGTVAVLEELRGREL